MTVCGNNSGYIEIRFCCRNPSIFRNAYRTELVILQFDRRLVFEKNTKFALCAIPPFLYGIF